MKYSPMMTHYLNLKEKYKDTILLYRLGDFYECFFEDAELVSKAIEIILTSKNCGNGQKAPMCGVPAHAIDSYLSKLVQRGYKVAICEQLSEPVKGQIVERDVIRVVTAGTVIEEDILTGTNSNYLACVYIDNKGGAISYLELSTGEFYAIDISGENITQRLNDELVRISPAEIICNEKAYKIGTTLAISSTGIIPKFEKYEEWSFDEYNAEEMIKKFFNILNIDTLEISKSRFVVQACGAILEYCNQTQKRELSHIKFPKQIKDGNYMYLDANSLRNLELTSRMRDGKRQGTLYNVLDYTKTNGGARLLKSVIEQPLQDANKINERLDAVEELVRNSAIRLSILSTLDNFADISRICSRLVYGSITPKDCLALKESFKKVPDLKNLLSKCKSKLLCAVNNKMQDVSALANLLEQTINNEPPSNMKNGNYIKKGYNKTLDEYRDIKEHGTKWITNLQRIEQEQTGIKTLKIKFNKVFGYFIEIPTSMAEKVPLRYVRKQTISNNERYITEELKEIEDKILNSEEKSLLLENEIYNYVREQLKNNLATIQDLGSAVAELDVYSSFAVTSEKNSYVKPNINTENKNLIIKGCRHPVVEQILKDNVFVPNDVNLNNDDERIMIITGPNMAGKSTYMREIAISVIMAHIGCFVPAIEASIPITDRIFTRVGASDDLSFGQSTFMVEMVEVANILNNATEKSLLILDEVGRGTSTYDGLSIAWSIMEYLSQKLKAKTLFATHYFELTELEGMLEGVKNYRISVKEYNDTIIFLRKIVRGGANKSFGIEVAKLAGVPKVVIDRAKEILRKLETTDSKNLNEINNIQLQTDKAQSKDNEILIEELMSVDTDNITPMMALEILNNLKDRVKKG